MGVTNEPEISMRSLAYEYAAQVFRLGAKDPKNVADAESRIEALDKLLPSGSGLDLGPRLDQDASTVDRLVFSHCDYHHMEEHGAYAGWSEHTVTVKPGFLGLHVKVSGLDRNAIKEVIAELFDYALSENVNGSP